MPQRRILATHLLPLLTLPTVQGQYQAILLYVDAGTGCEMGHEVLSLSNKFPVPTYAEVEAVRQWQEKYPARAVQVAAHAI